MRSLYVVQTAPPDHPYLRHHQVDVALYNIGASDSLVPGEVIPVAIDGDRTTVPLPGELPCPLIVNPNHSDWTYAQTGLHVELLSEILASLPQVSATFDPYFMASYGQALLTPMCVPQSVALLQ